MAADVALRRSLIPLAVAAGILCLGLWGCGAGAAALAGPKLAWAPYYEIDPQLGGMPVSRIAIPADWKGISRVAWSPDAYYMPVHDHIRVEAPDGGRWVEFYATEMFWWGDRSHDPGAWGGRDRSGAIHQANLRLPDALVRFVVAPNRRAARNLKVLGYRPVNGLPGTFPKVFPEGVSTRGAGICLRVQYEIGGKPVDEEFYAYMPPMDAIPAPPAGTEYHSYLMLVHSLGAKSGQLEAARPLLGFIATSREMNPAWRQKLRQIHQAAQQRAAQALAQGWASIERGRQLSAQAHASSEAFLARTDASLAQSRAQQDAARSGFNGSSSEAFERRTDGFDQYVRGTEHMKDPNGVVSDQYADYNYHWTDGFGRFVHTDDQGLDPNQSLNGNYQRMTPAP
jgi:hypothetical protein